MKPIDLLVGFCCGIICMLWIKELQNKRSRKDAKWIFVGIGIVAILSLLFFATTAGAQTAADVPAYFQWMNAVAADPRPEAIAAHLHAAGIQEKEHANVAKILQAFKDDEFGLEASYNNLPSTKAGQEDGYTLFMTKQAMLIQHAVILLRAALSPSSAKHLDDRVAHEAKNLTSVNLVRHSHPMLQNVSMSSAMPQGVMGMNPAYSLYSTMSAGQPGAGVTAAMLSEGCGATFPQWNAANLVDANTSDIGFSTDNATGGPCVVINFGATPQDVVETALSMSASGSTAQFNVFYSDGGSWTNTGVAFAPSDAGWNYQTWADAGAHQYWAIQLANDPGVGPTINELQLIKNGLMLFASFSVTGTTHCPSGCSGALHNGYVTNSLGSPVTGPQMSPTGFMNVVNAASGFLPAGGPPTTVGSSGDEVDCTVVQGPIQKMPIINNDWELGITYSQDLGVLCASPDPERPYCREIIDYCLPTSVPPDFDPTQVIGSHAWINTIKYWNQITDCLRPHGAAPGTAWECFWPQPPGMVEPKFEAARHPCTNFDKGTHGVWP